MRAVSSGGGQRASQHVSRGWLGWHVQGALVPAVRWHVSRALLLSRKWNPLVTDLQHALPTMKETAFSINDSFSTIICNTTIRCISLH